MRKTDRKRMNDLKKLKLNPCAKVPEDENLLKRLLPDDSARDLVFHKTLSLNLNFSFLNRIQLFFISSSWGDLVSDTIFSEQNLRYSRKRTRDLWDGSQTF